MNKISTIAILICLALSYGANITWRKDVKITSDFTVSSADVLTIEAGAIIRFAPYVRLIVNGEIKANGTVTEPVIFTSLDRGDTQWSGIEINSLSGVNEFTYSKFYFMNAISESGNAGMNLFESNVTISNCYFKDNHGEQGGAVKIVGGNVTVSDSYFFYNGASLGGAVYVLNNSSTTLSNVNINHCDFEHNEGWINGGAMSIQDNSLSANNMQLVISNCNVFENNSNLGGGIFYDNQGKIDIQLMKCKIFNNTSFNGSGIYMQFMKTLPGSVLAQKFSNLLVFKNGAYSQSGIYIDMGLTQNPIDINFTNASVVFNSLMPSKGIKQDFTSGIYIKSNGNYPKIRNSILWGSTNYVGASNFFIDDPTDPPLNNIFWYCDIEAYLIGGNNLNTQPKFIRPPINSELEQVIDIDRYDFHLRLGSPCINAGDPFVSTTGIEPDNILNIGAYGNTVEAAKYNFTTIPPTSSIINTQDNSATVIDFQGKSGKFIFSELNIGRNAEVYLQATQNVAGLEFDKITTLSNTKFDNVFAKIHTMDANTPVQNIRINQNAEFINADIYNLVFEVRKDILDANVEVRGTKFYCDSINNSPAALNIVNANSVTIQDSKFIDKVGGIIVDNSGLPVQGKATGRIANNTINFDADAVNKLSKSAKRVGIEIINANIDIEDNDITGGDEGIVMKTSSKGRIANNTINFDADAVHKKGLYDKIAILVENSEATEISENYIVNNDSENENVTGIEINGSKAEINYNTLLFEGYTNGISRTGMKFSSILDTLKVYNNTIYNPLLAFDNTTGASQMPVDIINNIFWSDQGTYTTINNTNEVNFFNNCFIDSSNISGPGNIFVDPEINCTWNNDFTLASTSPCINAGMIIDGVHSFLAGKTVYYYGTAPDIGANEYYQELTSPANVTVSVSGGDFTFGWDPVFGFNEYIVYSSNDPYGTFSVETITTNLSYTSPIGTKKFYYVVASDGSKSYLYDNSSVTAKTQAENKENAIVKKDKKKIRIKSSNSNK